MDTSRWTFGRVLTLWLTLGALVAVSYLALPRYLGSLDDRIVFASPDCMELSGQRAQDEAVPVAVRGDSLEVWMRGCLIDRQRQVARRAATVGWATTIVLGLGLIAMIALSVAWAVAMSRRPS